MKYYEQAKYNNSEKDCPEIQLFIRKLTTRLV